MRFITECREEILADLHLTLLRIVYREFRFSVEVRQTGRRHWVAVRRNIAAGLYAVVTDDLNELLAVLGVADFSCKPVHRDLAEVVVLPPPMHTEPSGFHPGEERPADLRE